MLLLHGPRPLTPILFNGHGISDWAFASGRSGGWLGSFVQPSASPTLTDVGLPGSHEATDVSLHLPFEALQLGMLGTEDRKWPSVEPELFGLPK